MPQFLLLADDYIDEGALSRRMAVREVHLERLRSEKAKGSFEMAAAKLNAEGKMIGSMMVINSESETAALDWAKGDPYFSAEVWEHITITPIRVASL